MSAMTIHPGADNIWLKAVWDCVPDSTLGAAKAL